MHEYPITQEIIRIALDYAAQKEAENVSRIALVVGEYSGYVAESIALYFDLIAEGTACEGAALSIRLVKPMLLCTACGGHFERKPFSFTCPDCDGEGAPTEIGREFYVESIDC